ncbi:BTAD domain-containing putative transcriptional regulator [Kribbella yunnanensis]|uniref:BTAD domain-containing putative transcriptional regulator n=1 Tax=Kribbella yunnanensis TaxID=190194 RepID=A0ABN2J639_9ACTN
MYFRLLGPVEVVAEPVALGGRERLVLAMLLINADRVTPSDRLIDTVWSRPPRSARQQLHNLIARLRRKLDAAGDLIVTRPLGYQLALAAHGLDLHSFRLSVLRGREQLQSEQYDDARGELGTALSLWRGDALADLSGDWAAATRESLHRERVAAGEALAQAQLATHDHAGVLETVQILLATDPLHEGLHDLRLRALSRSGRRTEALSAYQDLRRRLVDEFGVEPGPDLQETHCSLLRDLDPPLASPRHVPRQLPRPIALAGRDELLGRLTAVLRTPEPRPGTVLLVGAGGIGKTSLAVVLADRVQDEYPDGTLYAELDGTSREPRDPDEIIDRFLRALGATAPATHAGRAERLALYRSAIANRRVLVVLDDALDERQVRDLLPPSPRSAAIVTSRHRLAGLDDVLRRNVPTLSTEVAVELLQAGRDVTDPAPELAQSAVQLCGHLPLALMVVAARLASGVVDLAEVVEHLSEEHIRLDELAIGDGDVRASIALSYDGHLSAPAQRLLRRVAAVSVTTWPAWFAGVVLDDDVLVGSRALDELVDVHLVEPCGRDAAGQLRFTVHPLVAAFAGERAAREDDASAVAGCRRTAAMAWLGLASQADDAFGHGLRPVIGPDGATIPAGLPPPRVSVAAEQPAAWFDAEIDSIRDLVHALSRAGELDLAAALALRSDGYLVVRGETHVRAGLLRRVVDCSDLVLRWGVLRSLFHTAAEAGRFSELADLAQAQLDVARKLDAGAMEQNALVQLGCALRELGRFEEATARFEDASSGALARDDTMMAALARGHLGVLLARTGHPVRGAALVAENLQAERLRGPSRRLSIWLVTYADCLALTGDAAAAERALDEAEQLATSLVDRNVLLDVAQTRAAIALRADDIDRAERILDDSSAYGESTAPESEPTDGELRLRADLLLARGRAAEAAPLLERAVDRHRREGVRFELAHELARLTAVHAARGEQDRAGRQHAELVVLLRELGIGLDDLQLPPVVARIGGYDLLEISSE